MSMSDASATGYGHLPKRHAKHNHLIVHASGVTPVRGVTYLVRR